MPESESRSTEPTCPACGRHGRSGIDGYCNNHLPKERHPKYFKEPLGESDVHVLTPFEQKYNVDREFVPISNTFGLIKDKAYIIK